MNIVFKNIKQLVQVREEGVMFLKGAEMDTLPLIENAFLVIEKGKIAYYGSMSNYPSHLDYASVDATGKVIFPTWCDAHTHLVYAGTREQEFVDRIKGLSYEEIAKRGGGIINSALLLQKTSEEELYTQSKKRLEEVIKLGTGAIEIKSGYGLNEAAELKMLRVIKKLKKEFPLPIKSTFLGAHAVPPLFDGDSQKYLQMLVQEVLPKVADEQLSNYIDIFCEKNYFDADQASFLFQAAKAYHLIPKIHANQFSAIGGVQAAVTHQAISVDHLEVMREEDIQCLRGTLTMPVALPGCSFFLGIPYTPARTMLENDLPLALASDYNPGSAPSGNMNFVVAAACIKMKMTPKEAINAATINGAYAMGVENEVGSITVGKRANIILSKPIASYENIPYSFGNNVIDKVYLNGVAQ